MNLPTEAFDHGQNYWRVELGRKLGVILPEGDHDYRSAYFVGEHVCFDPNEFLRCAVVTGGAWIVDTLLSLGADINHEILKHDRIVDLANADGDHPTIKHLLRRGGKFVQAPSHLIHDAFKLNDVELILLLARGVEEPPVGSYVHNMLEVAVVKKNISILRKLLDSGLTAQHLLDGALYKAAWCGLRKEVELLVAWGANVNARGGDHGRSVLNAASFVDRPEIINFLIFRGAKVDTDNHAALRVSLQWCHKENVAVMLRHGAVLTDEIIEDVFRLTEVPDFVKELKRKD